MTISQFLIMAFGLLMYLGIFCFLVIRLIHSGVDYLRATSGSKGRQGRTLLTIKEACLRHTPPEST